MKNKQCQIEREIRRLKEKRQQLLDALYELGLAPFYGYYEMQLKKEE